MDFDIRPILIKAADLFSEYQLNIAVEELNELSIEILHHKRNKNTRQDILSERVDVGIMFEQLDVIFEFTESEINIMRKQKITRLQGKIEDELRRLIPKCDFCDKSAKIKYRWDVFTHNHCLDNCPSGEPSPGYVVLEKFGVVVFEY